MSQHQALLVVLSVLAHSFPTGQTQEVQWPVHTVCKTQTQHVFYRSCDPLQDIGFSFNPCPLVPPEKVNLRLSLLLRQSIKELYLSADVSINGGPILFHHDEPLCLSDFPRFTFCSRKKGELIAYEKPVKLNLHLPPETRIDAHAVLMNQNGHHIACLNITLINRDTSV